MTTTATPPDTDDLALARSLLASARADREAAEAAERRVLTTAAAWADAHAVAPGDLSTAYWSEGGLPVTGDGAPEVAEFCVSELACALGLTRAAGGALLGDAVELRHRLPRDSRSALRPAPATVSVASGGRPRPQRRGRGPARAGPSR